MTVHFLSKLYITKYTFIFLKKIPYALKYSTLKKYTNNIKNYH